MTDSEETSIKMTEILVALDHSSHSRAALESAAFIAELMEAKIHGLFVHDNQWLRISKLSSLSEIDELTGRISPIGREAVEREIQKLERSIRKHFEIISRQHQLPHRWSTEKGEVADKVLEAAENCDIITIGSKGRSYSRTKKLGSTAATIIRSANKPILILQKRHNLNYPPIAIFDGSKKSISGLKIAEQIARRNETHLTVIDLSKAFPSTEKSGQALAGLKNDTKILQLNQPNMGRFLFMINKLQGGLLILPKNERYTRINTIEHILDSADCPVLLIN
ncbi:universal stress protein [Rhodohalobacter barkolensis]|uniref:UspA domain-containing protein n=1 Tax=Rhodohalobacter barkolensis TaxID=2053187 RepID=A0A2N0VE61_9BACT|nr:universal stress protein [Rhodohalobacter barkolensis]PKD42477.1 hypothetical protein CWD77_13750 [Rhodohalobacter barkolensis]